ncbi:hypothetical protein LSM04_000785 [Trypanosoma melophagium]|uniref:uncharacterized protein n=1 Tax=Trypanosoma melophagium TaxID=715481 RepID=UPI00351A7F65|nr:hypothetical protein LSM04_000785 [Trypanosoma melophagium]
MSLLGGLAVEAPEEAISIVDVHRSSVKGSSSSVYVNNNNSVSFLNVYEVVLRLPQATVLAVATLRAACVTLMEGPLVEKKRRKKKGRQERTVRMVPIAVRVVKLAKGL